MWANRLGKYIPMPLKVSSVGGVNSASSLLDSRLPTFGAPFVAWDLPQPIQQVRDRILKHPKGDRAFVELLMLAGEAGLDALNEACELTLDGGIVSAPIVMNALHQR